MGVTLITSIASKRNADSHKDQMHRDLRNKEYGNIQKRHNKRRDRLGDCIKRIANNEKPVEKVRISVRRSVVCVIAKQRP